MTADDQFLDDMARAIRDPWPIRLEHRKAAVDRLANIMSNAAPAEAIRAVSILLAADRFNWEVQVSSSRLDGQKTEAMR